MAWNQPIKPTQANTKSAMSKLSWHFLFGCLVVLSVLIAAHFIVDNHNEPTVVSESKITRKQKILDVTPDLSEHSGNDNKPVEQVAKTQHSVGEIWFTDDGTKMTTVLKNGEPVDVPVFVPRNRRLPKTHIFNHPCDNQIANLLRLDPGVGTFGNRDYKGFKDAFLKSCEEPIIVSEDDDEWTRQLKRDVIETKIELRARMADGEDVEAIMRDTRNEYKKLANIKKDIESEVRNTLLNDDVTKEDIEILVEAANRLLEEKGIAPLKINPFVQRRILELKNGVPNE